MGNHIQKEDDLSDLIFFIKDLDEKTYQSMTPKKECKQYHKQTKL
ncbi:hypothetical protein IWQ47_000552 [Aquimarina sp. EL_43]|nr:hypothetical protein [Aquimarina sp. EL_35]MBG6149819.1 hypothetical protein [Aquimarina sp. EL_32]MBG6167494.1 hypothetical protein [Aquimarina sp. EL_43]